MSALAHAERHSWFEATARQRIAALVDAGSFTEFMPPECREQSPHLRGFDLPAAFDDGIIVGSAKLGRRRISSRRRKGSSWAARSVRSMEPS